MGLQEEVDNCIRAWEKNLRPSSISSKRDSIPSEIFELTACQPCMDLVSMGKAALPYILKAYKNHQEGELSDRALILAQGLPYVVQKITGEAVHPPEQTREMDLLIFFHKDWLSRYLKRKKK